MKLFTLFTFALFTITLSSQTTRQVPSQYSTIQAGLSAAQSGDTVLVQPGTYYENIIWPNVNGIKLLAAGDTSNTFINGGDIDRIFNIIYPSIDTTTEISGFNISGGKVSTGNGGAIQIINAGLKIQNVSIHNCNTLTGIAGAIYASGSTIIIRKSRIFSNTGFNTGGVFIDGNEAIIDQTQITYNNCSGNFRVGEGAGGIVLSTVTFGIFNSIISNNVSGLNLGGGVGGLAVNSGSGYITNVELNYNKAGGYIAACIIKGNAVLTNVSIIGNSDGNYCALAVWGDVELKNSLIANNNTTGVLVEYRNGGGKLKITKSKVIKNTLGILVGRDLTGGLIADSCLFVLNSTEGIKLDRCDSAFVSNCIFFSNSISGINNVGSTTNNAYFSVYNSTFESNNYGIRSIINDFKINNSNFIDNSLYGVYSPSTASFGDGTYNWWGDNTGPLQMLQNPSGLGDKVSNYVNVLPFLLLPDEAAPPLSIKNLHIIGKDSNSITFSWDVSPIGDLSGYKIYWDDDTSGYPYSNGIDIGGDTSYTLINLNPGSKYYISVTCYDIDGNESWYSNEVSSTITDVRDEIEIISEYQLSQNYPNPFNPRTIISYSLPSTSLVQLKIFNILGQEVTLLVNEEKLAGNYELTWITKGLPSGVYFYQIRAGDFVETKKMVLLK